MNWIFASSVCIPYLQIILKGGDFLALEIINLENARRKEVSDEAIRVMCEIAAHPETRRWCPMYRDNPDLQTRIKKTTEMIDQMCSPKSVNKNKFHLLAKLDGNLVGYAYVQRFSYEYETHVGSVQVVVHPEHRNKGIGWELLKTCINLARENSFRRLEGDVLEEDKASRRLLEKGGFQFEGLRRMNINMRGKLKNEVLYAILL